MSLVENLTELLAPVVSKAGFVLEEVKITPLGKRRLIAVIVDGLARNPNLDEVTVVSRQVSDILDSYSLLGDQPFTLEVTTPGVDRPLTLPRHWVKNIGRLVKITCIDGTTLTGRIVSANETEVTLESVEPAISFDQIKRAQIEIEFNRKVEQS
jgi:ribosome maturation factor RimP